MGETGNNNLILHNRSLRPRKVPEVTQLANSRARTRTNLQSKPIHYTSWIKANLDSLGFESIIITTLLVKYYFPSLMELSLSLAPKTLHGSLLCLFFLSFFHWQISLLATQRHLKQSVLFLLYMLKALTTNTTEYHWLSLLFYQQKRTAPVQGKLQRPASMPLEDVLHQWQSESCGQGPGPSVRINLTAPQWGWVPLAQSGHWLPNIPFTGFFPFLASFPSPPPLMFSGIIP